MKPRELLLTAIRLLGVWLLCDVWGYLIMLVDYQFELSGLYGARSGLETNVQRTAVFNGVCNLLLALVLFIGGRRITEYCFPSHTAADQPPGTEAAQPADSEAYLIAGIAWVGVYQLKLAADWMIGYLDYRFGLTGQYAGLDEQAASYPRSFPFYGLTYTLLSFTLILSSPHLARLITRLGAAREQ